jgi:hypothetical protein
MPTDADDTHETKHKMRSYGALGVEMLIDFIIMYFVMYTMIASLGHLYLNINNVYMTLMMVAPMTIVMLVAMRSMYRSKRMNFVIAIAATVTFVLSFIAMRTQAAVGDEQFLRSMIPHHSGAILMCGRATLSDPQIVTLCDSIVESQQREIAEMQAILERHRSGAG